MAVKYLFDWMMRQRRWGSQTWTHSTHARTTISYCDSGWAWSRT